MNFGRTGRSRETSRPSTPLSLYNDAMLREVTHVEALGGTRLRLSFHTGERGEVDIAQMVSFTGVFEPLSDAAYFARVRVEPDLSTIVWPNGADLCPDVLYAAAMGLPIPGSQFGLKTAS